MSNLRDFLRNGRIFLKSFRRDMCQPNERCGLNISHFNRDRQREPYFVLGLAAGGSCAQKPVVWPLSLQQVQRPPQCTVALHVVPQAPGKPWAAVFNCRAETVPASRTVATIVANNVFLPIFLIMYSTSFSLKIRF
jgi:hypothetical protein